MDHSYLAVVKQPACYNVFLVGGVDERKRLKQSTGAECVNFAQGYAKGVEDWSDLGSIEIKYFQCGEGDAEKLEWRGL